MSVDYYVAVHAADWPTPSATNQCLSKLHYPVSISNVSKADVDRPLAMVPNTLGLITEFEGKSVELEASITRLGPAYWSANDLNTALKEIGLNTANYQDGDYLLTFSFRSSIPEYRAGAFLMAGLIKCANGMGFEFQGGTFGTDEYANSLAREAANPDGWK